MEKETMDIMYKENYEKDILSILKDVASFNEKDQRFLHFICLRNPLEQAIVSGGDMKVDYRIDDVESEAMVYHYALDVATLMRKKCAIDVNGQVCVSSIWEGEDIKPAIKIGEEGSLEFLNSNLVNYCTWLGTETIGKPQKYSINKQYVHRYDLRTGMIGFIDKCFKVM